jgi:hypothetical protein
MIEARSATPSASHSPSNSAVPSQSASFHPSSTAAGSSAVPSGSPIPSQYVYIKSGIDIYKCLAPSTASQQNGVFLVDCDSTSIGKYIRAISLSFASQFYSFVAQIWLWLPGTGQICAPTWSVNSNPNKYCWTWYDFTLVTGRIVILEVLGTTSPNNPRQDWKYNTATLQIQPNVVPGEGDDYTPYGYCAQYVAGPEGGYLEINPCNSTGIMVQVSAITISDDFALPLLKFVLCLLSIGMVFCRRTSTLDIVKFPHHEPGLPLCIFSRVTDFF